MRVLAKLVLAKRCAVFYFFFGNDAKTGTSGSGIYLSLALLLGVLARLCVLSPLEGAACIRARSCTHEGVKYVIENLRGILHFNLI